MNQTLQVKTPYGVITGALKSIEINAKNTEIAVFHSLEYALLPELFQESEKLPKPAGTELPNSLPKIDATAAQAPNSSPLQATIYAPAHTKYGADLPVFIWLAGTSPWGDIHPREFPLAELCAQGVICVHLQYRGSIAGFWPFFDDEPHQYRGTNDIQLGLEWLQTILDYFGGDPTQITLSGHGRDAAAALWMARTDHYRGAFRRLIAFSPCYSPHRAKAIKAKLRNSLSIPITRKHLSGFAQRKPAVFSRRLARFQRNHPWDIAWSPREFEVKFSPEIPLLISTTAQEYWHGFPRISNLKPIGLAKLLIRMLGSRLGLTVPAGSYITRLNSANHISGISGQTKLWASFIADAFINRWVAIIAEQIRAPIWFLNWCDSTADLSHGQELEFLCQHPEQLKLFLGFIKKQELSWPRYQRGTARVGQEFDINARKMQKITDPLERARICFAVREYQILGD
ncbi:carboxylesterase family protein [Corynebacterium caspium]|uniref:carboxylesterase family protein n=1 Tax=Corynebacterium caspium TaxID=234828 RepID=UPI0003601B1F|nr:carboxylesterase family protein [Corynebacterium caspium]WKD58884.1 Carboxylesterase [Corynebacterium caspium DSM 44850]